MNGDVDRANDTCGEIAVDPGAWRSAPDSLAGGTSAQRVADPRTPGVGVDAAGDAVAAVNDARRDWPGRPGHSNGPRFSRALAMRFAGGESLASIADDYRVPMADVLVAVRQELRDVAAFGYLIGRAIDAYEAPRALCANPATPEAAATLDAALPESAIEGTPGSAQS